MISLRLRGKATFTAGTGIAVHGNPVAKAGDRSQEFTLYTLALLSHSLRIASAVRVGLALLYVLKFWPTDNKLVPSYPKNAAAVGALLQALTHFTKISPPVDGEFTDGCLS